MTLVFVTPRLGSVVCSSIACVIVLVPWYLEAAEQEDKRLSWATTTRALRRLKPRITKVRGKRDQSSPSSRK